MNIEGGFHIARTDSVEGCGLRDKTNKEVYYIACFKSSSNGKYFAFSMNKKYVKYYQDIFERYPSHYKDIIVYPSHYKDIIVFTSTDDKKFAHYPKCRKGVRGCYVTEKEYNEYKQYQTLGIRHIAA